MAPKSTSQIYSTSGSRLVALYVPFEFEGSQVTAIEIGPCRLDHLLRWQKGEFKTALELLAVMCEVPEALLRQLAYPDVDRVLAAYVDMVPPQIQMDIGRGAIPAIAEPARAEPEPADLGPVGEPEPEPEPEPGWPYTGSPPEEEPEANLDLVSER